MSTPESGDKPYFVAKLLVAGSARQLHRMRAHILLTNPEFRGGAYEVVGNGLWHLAGWTTCEATALQMAAAMDSVTKEGGDVPGQVALLTRWPVNVSAWQPVRLSDAVGKLHLPPKAFADAIKASEAKHAH
ncbi:hypothetical protein [Xanthomonas citri]|uniref:hypothetical protein n=1 Tax=Xanthomonas citri TaxID=346 RepID=UPI0001CED39B|nr:hypothetical protein [Xanthomonas citri]AMV00086.1 hypothetical protein TP37_19905 [Xanthomonas citri pv. aurantifolii]AMV02089.1 hypothetical protein TP50_06225 [Xanthomonas citri pv. aurantifolii]EFF47361.1 hypothetical protein XAUC_22530 [Xanthomonas citri pv. aurantifolii str. ICPB 10535]MCC8490865.1 hypothetical protein [Xanthomonas citri pv. fuscans]TBW97977.1 hypothetical protein TP47_09645 [Xanthomonas citri pv. aurantifolii]